MSSLERNLSRVRGRIADACRKAGRKDEVTLVAVTKTVDEERIRALHKLGVRDVGENRAQAGVPKAEALAGLGLRWHFIGGLQRNKVRKVLSCFQAVHALDDLGLAKQVDHVARELNWVGEVLVQVNVAGEVQKGGIAAIEAEWFVGECMKFPGFKVGGLMTMAPLDPDPEKSRPVFAGLREIRDKLRASTGLALPHLSMGMSQDFEVAVEEGSTLVRVGTALYEP